MSAASTARAAKEGPAGLMQRLDPQQPGGKRADACERLIERDVVVDRWAHLLPVASRHRQPPLLPRYDGKQGKSCCRAGIHATLWVSVCTP